MGSRERRASLKGLEELLSKVALSARAKRELASFLRLLKDELKVEEVYLFGSRVYGVPLKDSDLDMLVTSKEFEKYSFIERVIILSKLWNGSFTLEMFPYTPQELEKYRGKKVVVTEALERGIRVSLH